MMNLIQFRKEMCIMAFFKVFLTVLLWASVSSVYASQTPAAVLLMSFYELIERSVVDIRVMPDLVALLEHFDSDELASVCPALVKIKNAVSDGVHIFSSDDIKALLYELEMMTGAELRSVSHEVVGSKIAKIGLGTNYNNSVMPFTTKVAPQHAKHMNAVQTVEIGCASDGSQAKTEVYIAQAALSTNDKMKVEIGGGGSLPSTTILHDKVIVEHGIDALGNSVFLDTNADSQMNTISIGAHQVPYTVNIAAASNAYNTVNIGGGSRSEIYLNGRIHSQDLNFDVSSFATNGNITLGDDITNNITIQGKVAAPFFNNQSAPRVLQCWSGYGKNVVCTTTSQGTIANLVLPGAVGVIGGTVTYSMGQSLIGRTFLNFPLAFRFVSQDGTTVQVDQQTHAIQLQVFNHNTFDAIASSSTKQESIKIDYMIIGYIAAN